MTLVSVIIPTRNRAPLLREAIESVLAVQRDDFEIEAIVIDDGSTDETPQVAAAYPVRYLRTEGLGLGASAARNAGMRAAQGDFIAFLDDDDVWLPGNIQPQLNVFKTHPEYGMVHAQVILTNADRSPYGEPVPSGPLKSGWIFDELLNYWPQLGCVVVRTSVVREIGDFNPAYRAEEEWDWMLRIAERYQIGRIEQPVMLFRQRGYGDEELTWRRMPDTLRVLRKYTAGTPERSAAGRRLRRKIRGWYASQFLMSARYYAKLGNRNRSLHCIYYATRASLPHTVVLAAQSREWEI